MHLRLIGLCVVSLFLLVSCQNEKDDTLSERNTDTPYMQVKNPNNEQSSKQKPNGKGIADHLANIASDVPNVNSASAIVAGPYALVGIDVDQDLDRARVGTVKYTVSEALQHDDYGKTAVVVADGDIMERIREMRRHMQEGQPVQGVIEELSAIIGRYMPDLPVPEERPKNDDQNKDILDDEEEDELEDIERDQSKTD